MFLHRNVHGVIVADMDAGFVDANEVAEGMHAIYFSFYQRLCSDMASDPAGANQQFSRFYLCTGKTCGLHFKNV